MQWLWTWGGKCFGYLDGEDLWTYDGKHIGNRKGDEIYGVDGKYIGEVMKKNRLITNLSKKSKKEYSFSPFRRQASYAKYADCAGYAMNAGYEDFSPPESF